MLQLRDPRWVKSQATKLEVFGFLQPHHVTQHFWSIKLLVVTLWSNPCFFKQGRGLKPYFFFITTLTQVLSSGKQSSENSKSVHLQLNEPQGMSATWLPPSCSCFNLCQTVFDMISAQEWNWAGLRANVSHCTRTEGYKWPAKWCWVKLAWKGDLRTRLFPAMVFINLLSKCLQILWVIVWIRFLMRVSYDKWSRDPQEVVSLRNYLERVVCLPGFPSTNKNKESGTRDVPGVVQRESTRTVPCVKMRHEELGIKPLQGAKGDGHIQMKTQWDGMGCFWRCSSLFPLSEKSNLDNKVNVFSFLGFTDD